MVRSPVNNEFVDTTQLTVNGLFVGFQDAFNGETRHKPKLCRVSGQNLNVNLT